MTSVTQLEIIDLTESTPPIEKENETFDSLEDGTHIGPEKSVATRRTRRKHKNGEISKAHGTPARSRDSSLERGHAPSLEEISAQLAEGGKGSIGEFAKKKNRRSKKSKGKNKEMDSSPPPSREDTQKDTLPTLDDEQLFFIDTAPAPVPAGMGFDLKSADDDDDDAAAAHNTVPLLLPAHVSVLDPGDDFPVQIIEDANSDSDSESYIEYLDYDDRLAPGVVRYFEASMEEQKHARFLCKRCGAENEHRTNECPVQICLTCGARDEHSTRSCPISKTCFTCGMKGHINKNCPNRHSRNRPNQYDDCDRCGSDRHNTNECPTIWRLYEYVTDREREVIHRHRESKQSLALGNGGEGYIARDEWCHNCGNSGHLGDDCTERSRPYDTPSLPSAFGLYNTLSGPFSDAASSPIRTRAPRDWENSDTFGDGWGTSAPINVGKRARNKDRMRMEQRALELQERDDQDDWFGNPRNSRHSRAGGGGGDGIGSGNGNGVRVGKKDAKIRIGRSWKSDDPPPRASSSSPPPPYRKLSLLDRLDGDGSSSGHRGYHGRDRDRDRDRNRERDRDRDRGGRDINYLNWDHDRDRGRRDRDEGESGLGLRIRGLAGKKRDSRRGGDDEERESRRREENQKRDRDREREPRASRDDRGPQYRGGYARMT